MIPIKVLTTEQWDAFKAEKKFTGSKDDLRDGFIHMSFAHQLFGTLERYYKNQNEVILLKVAPVNLIPYKIEKSRGGDYFPHYYDALTLGDIKGALTLSISGGLKKESLSIALEKLDIKLDGTP